MSTAALVRQSTIDAVSGLTVIPILIYVRISRDKEGQEAGVARQGEDCHALAATVPGGRVERVYCDNDISASTNHDVADLPRPEYDLLMAHAARLAEAHGQCLIIAWKTSRLTRRPGENEDMIRLARSHNVEFRFVKSPSFALRTAGGALISRLLAAVDAELPESISEQAVRAKEQAAVDGIYYGGRRPFGYTIERDYGPSGLPVKGSQRLVVCDREATLIRSAVAYVIATTDKPNLAAIARQWTAAGVKPTQDDGPWSQSSIRMILINPKIAGRSVRHGQDVGPGRHAAIITPDQSAAVRAKLKDPKRRCNPSNTRTSLLSALALCGSPGCGGRIRASSPNYRGKHCPHCVIPAKPADAKVLGVVCALLKAHGASLLAENRSADLERLTEEALAVNGKIDALALAFAQSESGSPRALAVATGRLEGRLAEIEREQASLINADGALMGVADAADPVRAFLDAPLERQRGIIDTLVTVTILPGVRGRVSAAYRAAHPVADRVIVKRHRAP